jgi:predicted secreted protein
MPFITFIYKIGRNKKIYYGKYVCDYISDDHEGLDDEIRPKVLQGINDFRKKNNISKEIKFILIGILSFSSDKYIPLYSSNKEIKCFNFYYKKHDNNKEEIYVNGNIV